MFAAASESSETPGERLERRLEWFQDQKFGFFVHWGAYSQWGCLESWPLVEVDEWARADDLPAWVERGKDMEKFKKDYWALNRTFNPVDFNPEAWAKAAKYAGMRYFVFTTKHHDGFSMFDTQQTDYRITGPDCPFHTDPRANVALELFNAFRAEGFGIGAYFSKADWHSPHYWDPERPAKTRNPNYDTHAEPERWAKFTEFVHAQIEELMTGYGEIDVLWLDAGQVRPPDQDIDMDRLVAIARSHQPDLIVADRTVGGPHENYKTPEQKIPEEPILDTPWETCMTMGDQWSYKPDDDYKSVRELIHTLIEVVAKGGNLLLNVGPQPNGELPAVALSRMKEIGDWMRFNGEAIFSTRPVAPYRQGKLAFTQRRESVYAIYLLEEGETSLPATLTVPAYDLKVDSKVAFVGAKKNLVWKKTSAGVEIMIPEELRSPLPFEHAVAFRMTLTGEEEK